MLQLEQAGGQSLELLDIALRNIRRLEQTADWACDYLAMEPCSGTITDDDTIRLTDLLEDLDELDVPTPLSWATGAGDWDALVAVSRENWRRVLRQVMRALGYQASGQSIQSESSARSYCSSDCDTSSSPGAKAIRATRSRFRTLQKRLNLK